METEKKLALMQNTYAASIAETVNTYEKLKVLDYVVEKKRERQPQAAPYINQQLEVENVEDVFIKLSDAFGCADWNVEKLTDGYCATATMCKLCALSKKIGGASPCRGWCLDPMSAMIMAVTSGEIKNSDIEVISTLMDGECCNVKIKA